MKALSNSLLSSVLAVVLFAANGPRPAMATMILNSPTGTVGNNFNTYQGTLATVPSDFTVGGSQSGGYQGFFTDGSSAYTTTNGLYAGTETPVTTDTGFAARVPVGNNLTLTWSVKNNTGQSLPGLSLSYTEVQYQDATATPNTISLTSDNGSGGVSFDSTHLMGNTVPNGTGISFNELQAGGTTTVYPDPLTELLTASYNQAIPNGATVEFQFTWTPGGGGNRPIFGITDLAITGLVVVPEPSSIALFLSAGACLCFAAARRRRRANAIEKRARYPRISSPVSVPVLDPNRSAPMPRRWSRVT